MNAASLAIDSHKGTERENATALIWESESGEMREYTFLELSLLSNKAANILTDLKIAMGDRVFLFLPRRPELYYFFLGIVKTGAIAGTLFSAFGPQGLADRLSDSGCHIVVTTKNLLPRIEEVRNELPELQEIIVVDSDDFIKKINAASDTYAPNAGQPSDFAFMLYTSGTTGKPKGVVHTHGAIQEQKESARLALDLRSSDIYWCTADPGWVTGVSYTILGNWVNGITTVVYEGKFDPDKWYQIIEKYKISVWYTAPTAIRLLMAKSDIISNYDLSSLRYMVSVGEPLNPEAVTWSEKVFGKPFHDSWFQTETGSIMIANTPELKVKPGSMGKPLPGITADIVDDGGSSLSANIEGNLVLRPGWASQMAAIWKNEEKYNSYFVPPNRQEAFKKDPGSFVLDKKWYYSGDRAYKDEDGYFWFVGRADDVIKTSGERVGPFEVESALIKHPSVIEAGVIGKPDEVRGEIIKAFVVLKPEIPQTEELKIELSEFVKKHLAGHAYPREIEFIDKLPKTRSGKIMRRVLKAKELGQPIGDTSTLEEY